MCSNEYLESQGLVLLKRGGISFAADNTRAILRRSQVQQKGFTKRMIVKCILIVE